MYSLDIVDDKHNHAFINIEANEEYAQACPSDLLTARCISSMAARLSTSFQPTIQLVKLLNR